MGTILYWLYNSKTPIRCKSHSSIFSRNPKSVFDKYYGRTTLTGLSIMFLICRRLRSFHIKPSIIKHYCVAEKPKNKYETHLKTKFRSAGFPFLYGGGGGGGVIFPIRKPRTMLLLLHAAQRVLKFGKFTRSR